MYIYIYIYIYIYVHYFVILLLHNSLYLYQWITTENLHTH